MINTIIVAKKEFRDLLSDRFVIFAIAVFLVLIISQLYDTYFALSEGKILYEKTLTEILLNNSIGVLSSYGSFVALIIGFSSISAETNNAAISTLLVKPLYRDTIINGKLIGAFVFLSFIIHFAMLFYISGLFLVCGSSLVPVLGDFLMNIPLCLAFSIIYATIYFAIAMLITLIIKDQAYALILCVVAVIVSSLIVNVNIAGNIGLMFESLFDMNYNDIVNVVVDISPRSVIGGVMSSGVFSSMNLMENIRLLIPHYLQSILYVFILVSLSYVVFIRRDVS